MSWRPKENWFNPYYEDDDGTMRKEAYEAGADEMHKADVEWLIQRIIHDDRGYVFKMTDKEWQEFIR